MAAVIGGHFFCLPMADGECQGSAAPMSDSLSSIFSLQNMCAFFAWRNWYTSWTGLMRPWKQRFGLLSFSGVRLWFGIWCWWAFLWQIHKKIQKRVFFFIRFNLLIIRLIGKLPFSFLYGKLIPHICHKSHIFKISVTLHRRNEQND